MLCNMGCNFSKQAVKIVHRKTSDRASHDGIKSDDSESKTEENHVTVIPALSPQNANSYLKSSILTPHTLKSVELKNGVVCNDNPPVAMATIIRGSSEPLTPKNNTHTVTLQLPHQADDLTSTTPVKKTVVITRPLGTRKAMSNRRSSDGDVNVKSSNPTCVTHPFGKDGLPVGGSLPDLQKQKTRSSPFGPRNSKLVLTQSQVDFFRMLDEKVAQGKDYCSEDDQSLASMQSWHNTRKDSSSSNGLTFKLMQGVR
uniref:Uncharacterized protein LOC100185669 n=1 Tax=Phallusia mammillata TaxID=59560 RepID=A0A6F9DII0_9ASCI|nr:uncharacterized protein LOC100185669 [Phallusia mammillata]